MNRLRRLVVAALLLGSSLASRPPMAHATAADTLRATVAPLDAATRALMTGVSWRPGCPVGLDDLRLVTVVYLGFDGQTRRGPLVVHRTVATKVASAFDEIYRAGFPIERVQLVDDFDADDDTAVLANNTSGFNCRRAEGSTHWSEHAFGKAIDINPLQNPYVYADGHVLDPAAKPFVDRRVVRPGMITARGPVVVAFRRIGWGWGGTWSRTKDYQHVSASGH